MKVLVTGGAGYIGSHGVRQLQRAGYQTLVVDNLIYGHRDFLEKSEHMIGDLQDQAFVESIFAKHTISAVMHFAAFAYVGESVQEPAKYYRNNLVATLNLLDAMRAYGVKYFIFSSTCATYGEPKQVPIPETHPQQPINPYGRSKLMIEQILRDYDHAYGIKSVSLRYFNAAGADPEGDIGEDHTPETHLIPLLLDVAMGRRPFITIYGDDYPTPDGTCIRDYIHVTDLAQAHVLGLKYLEAGGRSDAFNLGNGQGFSVREVHQMAERVTGKAIKAIVGKRRPGDPAKLVGSAEKAQRTLGWQPRFADLETIIRTAWQWHQVRFAEKPVLQA
ncbi:MAG: UDP-glucose 4-epimerase GalE [Chloroherpetonaceae bacterium]|nr:UDP-glucose 4-epimerase GalE [Chloroherpetonaceae bacterium]MDW8018715.1 UDP-glucose 4-epimerase GalE [Chloroherpetonaceae bacterium]